MRGVVEVTACTFKGSASESVISKRMKHTITFGNDLSNTLQTFLVISDCELYLYEENRDGAKCFEEVLNATLRTNTTSDDTLWIVPQLESELFN